jgi:hypothetical protein
MLKNTNTTVTFSGMTVFEVQGRNFDMPIKSASNRFAAAT